jgi:hypothetical protein
MNAIQNGYTFGEGNSPRQSNSVDVTAVWPKQRVEYGLKA